MALIKAFVRLREVLAENQVVAKRLAEVEKTLVTHDAALRDLSEDKTASPASVRALAKENRVLN